jgi:hypothetical protein
MLDGFLMGILEKKGKMAKVTPIFRKIIQVRNRSARKIAINYKVFSKRDQFQRTINFYQKYRQHSKTFW